jgi:hypothetical protein
MTPIDPAVARLLGHLEPGRRPEAERDLAAPFHGVAAPLAEELRGDEVPEGVRRLLEAQDAACRADPAPPGDPHPAVAGVLRFFAYEHLPPHLQRVSRPLGELARDLARKVGGPEAVIALRKLLEAKDCLVRAALSPTR